MTDQQDAEHQAAMQETQQKVRAAIAAAKDKRGVIIYLYGQGKGKSSSGFGTLLRSVGHGQQAGSLGKLLFLAFRLLELFAFHVPQYRHTGQSAHREQATDGGA